MKTTPNYRALSCWSKTIHKRHPELDLTSALFTPNWWRRAAALFALVSALGMMFYFSPRPSLQQNIDISAETETSVPQGLYMATSQSVDLTLANTVDTPQAASDGYARPYGATLTTTLKDRETLGEAVTRQGISAGQAFTALAALDKVHRVKSVRPGLEIKLTMTPRVGGNGPILQSIAIKSDFQSLAMVTRNEAGTYTGERIQLRTQKRNSVVRGPITASLYIAAEREGMPASTIISLIRALSYRVDFQREIRAGDTFAALYSMETAADGSVSPGDVDYAELDLGDRIEKLYRFKNPDTGRTDFFDEKGESMRRLLMRTPIDGARLTSSFGKRKHPVLGYVKSHQGVDFGASTGTPIYAAGDGVIERANRFGSYGNYVLIRHPRKFKTAYAHLSRFAKGMRPGKKVQQGQVIGYVGATGRVTGPHLHYEVYRRGVRVNPMRLDLPTGELLSGSAMTAFKALLAQTEATLAGETAAR